MPYVSIEHEMAVTMFGRLANASSFRKVFLSQIAYEVQCLGWRTR